MVCKAVLKNIVHSWKTIFSLHWSVFLNTDDLKKIKTVEFVKMPEGTVTYKIEQTYEQFNKEPVFG